MSFSAEQRDRLASLWELMLAHPFLLQTRDGTIGDNTFARWMRQDYLFVQHGVHFLAGLLARAPKDHRDALADAINALRSELALFQERASAVGIELDRVRPAFVTHAYMQFLTATAMTPYAEAYTVLYVAERAYHDSWRVVSQGTAVDSKWRPFVENWAGDAFAGYVAYLGRELDELAASASVDTRDRMADLFELTTRYEIAFWEMAISGESWPGPPEGAIA